MLSEQKGIIEQANVMACEVLCFKLNCFNKYFLNIHKILLVMRDDHDYIPMYMMIVYKNLKI